MPAEKDVHAQVKKDKAMVRKQALKAVSQAMQELKRIMGDQNRIARMTGIPQSAVSEVSNGKRLPEADTLIIMARMLHRSVDSILGLADSGRHTPALDMLLAMANPEARRALYERLHDEFGRASETPAEIEEATELTRPSLPPPPPPESTDSTRSRQRREK